MDAQFQVFYILLIVKCSTTCSSTMMTLKVKTSSENLSMCIVISSTMYQFPVAAETKFHKLNL